MPCLPATTPEGVPNAFRDTVRRTVEETLAGMVGETPRYSPALSVSRPSCGVLGTIAFFGDVSWAMTLAFPQGTALGVSLKFAGFDIPFESPDMGDVVGELANILGGDVSSRLGDHQIKAQISLPTVIRGHDLELLLQGGSRSERIGYSTSHGKFWVKLDVAGPGQAFRARRSGT